MKYLQRMFMFCFGSLAAISAFGEDIELYVTDLSQASGYRAKVLVIFDNSGSMTSMISVKSGYDPNTVYPAVGSDHSLSDRFVYYNKGTGVDSSAIPVPDGPSEQRRFLFDINSCAESLPLLNEQGFYTGFMREYAFQGQNGSWNEIPDNNGANIEIIDCLDDIQKSNSSNPGKDKDGNILSDGFPIDGAGDKKDPIYHDADVNKASAAFGSGEVITLYTDNYLRWYHSEDIPNVSKSRLQVAQEAINQVINSTNAADFGIAVFNRNSDYYDTKRNGGRIIFGIQQLTDAARTDMTTTISGIEADTWTPLCETMYEAYRYFSGGGVYFGDDDTPHKPSRDNSIESSGSYISPFNDDCNGQVNIVVVTDGAPTRDSRADILVSGLPGVGSKFNGNYMPALAEWMHNNDINTNVEGNQFANTYTIGFASAASDPSAEPILVETAKRGGGEYISAGDPNQLVAAFQQALTAILNDTATFTSPSIATNNFDRTEHLDSVYYAMFLPGAGPRWRGNLKKLKITGGAVVDRVGAVAIDESGNIKDSAKTFWGSSTDGNDVTKGGVAEYLAGVTTRTLYSDVGSGGGLTALTQTSAATFAGGDAALATYMGAAQADLPDYFNWLKGIDVDDDDNDSSTTDRREDTFGDPLHSKPLVINYGSDDLRIVVGTNHGFLHMFKDSGSTVSESWAFLPYELLPIITKIRDNTGSQKAYGIDGSPSVYVDDKDGDGIIEAASGEKAWLVVGMRRGGSNYYALDISDPDSPSIMWRRGAGDTGFEEMAQTWGKASFGKLEKMGHEKPLVFLSAGYDANNNDSTDANPIDGSGRGVFVLELATGNLMASLTPGGTTSIGFTESIPGGVTPLDSDADGYIDRLYAADTGGDVWRMDIMGTDSSKWGGYKLAALGKNSVDTGDRRFYYRPTVVQTFVNETKQITDAETGEVTTVHQQVPFDAVLVGSGNRSHPKYTSVNDYYFMVQDKEIVSKSFTTVPAVIDFADLYDITASPFDTLSNQADKLAKQLAYSGKHGWKLSLVQSGEKSLSESRVLSNVLYFNSFVPGESVSGAASCEPQSGLGYLYAIDLVYGYSIYSWRSLSVGERVPDVPILYATENAEGDQELHLVGVGQGDDGSGTVLIKEEINGGLKECNEAGCTDKDPDGDNLQNVGLSFGRTYYHVSENND